MLPPSAAPRGGDDVAGSGNAHLRDPKDTLLRVENLVVEFPVGRTGLKVHAVSDISVDARPGETLGLVGESGCGKSTTGKAVMQIERPTSGSITFDGEELTELEPEALRQLRPKMQMIFQDPISSLNPRRRVGDIVAEPLRIWSSHNNPPGPSTRLAQRLLQLTGAIGLGGLALWILIWIVDGFMPYLLNTDTYLIPRPLYESLLADLDTAAIGALLGALAISVANSVRDRTAQARRNSLILLAVLALAALTGTSTLAGYGRALAVQSTVPDSAFIIPEDALAAASGTDRTTKVVSSIDHQGDAFRVVVTVNKRPTLDTSHAIEGAGSLALLVGQWLPIALALAVAATLLTPPTNGDFKRMAEIRAEHDAIVRRTLTDVGLDPDTAVGRRPHQFSGGQCQRICIARALVLDPKVIICDEPVSALDVSVQAQILNLLEEMKQRYNLTLVFIAHDLAVVKNVSDRIAVMYLGKICEVAPSDDLYINPAHPYTAALLSSIPVPDPTIRPHAETVLGGEIPSPVAPPSGCRFRTRCPRAQDRCAQSEPKMNQVGLGHYVACHFPLEATAKKPGAAELAARQGA
jgi:oligopeptide/dipeptide ABC transporter ATP-binding protein